MESPVQARYQSHRKIRVAMGRLDGVREGTVISAYSPAPS